MPTSFKKRLETFSKPSQFRRLKELFTPTLVPFTLWLAIAAFAASILLDFDVGNVKWILQVVLRMEVITENTANIVHFLTIIVFGIAFVASVLIIATMILSWTGLNTIRILVFLVNKIRLGVSKFINRLKELQ